MGITLLQEFLSSRLLDIGADDSRLDKLESTCSDLAKAYATNPQSALSPLLAAWDPSAGENPSLLQIGSALQNHWPTYRGAFKGEPLTLYRAVVLESVLRAMELQGVLAVAVKLLADNILPQLGVGQESHIFETFVERADAITAERLKRAWPDQVVASNLAPLTVPPMHTLKSIDEDTWFAKVAAAAGPDTNRSDVTISDANTYWPNSPQNWSYGFADRMAPVLADVHDRAATNALKVAGAAFKSLADALTAKLNEFLAAEQARSNQRDATSRLLWWRQSLFSETAETPYRKLPTALVAWHMALDMARLLPEVYPAAVESLLFESVRAATGAQGETEITLKELLQVDGTTSKLAQLTWLKEQQTDASRTLLVQALANSYGAGIPELAKLGVDADLKMLPADWAIWLLREIKVLEALAAPDEVEQPAEAAA